MEFLGLTFFLIPYCAIVIWFSVVYAYDSWAMSEISASTVGLTHRWIIKTVLVVGLVTAVISGIAVWLQVVIVLWGPRNIRFPLMTLEWPEEAGTMLEGKTRLELDKMEDELERRERERRERESRERESRDREQQQAGWRGQAPRDPSQES
jgi:signal transduction histidine kinase